jgi:predicted membrane channel-forming protein YqfA (hemolysin III family)
VLLVAFLAAFLQSLVRLTSSQADQWLPLAALSVTTGVSIAAIWLVPRGPWRRLYVTSSVALAAMTLLTLNVLIDLHPAQKLEIICVAIGVLLLGASYVARFQETDDEQPRDVVTTGLWIGSLLAALPLLVAVIYHRANTGPSLPDELAIVTVTILMLVTGLSWRAKSTTLIGGAVLMLYLVIMIGRLAWHPQIAMGVYLAAGGALVFACGIALSIYRERLLALPERIAKREGIFRVIDWR